MKSLMLLRHAHAVPASPACPDFERPLSSLGQSQSRQIGACLQVRAWEPQRVLSSTAKRANETTELALAAAGLSLPPVLLDQLYNANVDEMLTVLREQAADIDRLLLVAHAPGIGELVSALCTRAFDLNLECEPATLIKVTADITSWTDIQRNCASLRMVLPA